MELKLSLAGHFDSEAELLEMVAARKICYDSEPYFIPDKKGSLLQVGFRLTLYGTFPANIKEATPDSEEYGSVEHDLERLAAALSDSCAANHMCGSVTADPSSLSYSQERKMRPDVTVHIPIFDQENFGRPVDDEVRNTMHEAIRLLESAGVRKTSWHD